MITSGFLALRNSKWVDSTSRKPAPFNLKKIKGLPAHGATHFPMAPSGGTKKDVQTKTYGDLSKR